MTTNLDGVVYGVQAVLPDLRARDGGSVVAMAGMAGLVPVPLDPVHGTAEAAVVDYARSPAPPHAHEGIRINALCPGFAETPIIDGSRGVIQDLALPILDVSEAVAAVESVVVSPGTGECRYVQSGAQRAAALRRPAGPRSPRADPVRPCGPLVAVASMCQGTPGMWLGGTRLVGGCRGRWRGATG
ncbi:SDR family NAD(P)-dependent oxidoreductase [Saccharothrix yanglingensis]|uniref:SDR family NAD(P)-dependent oxidoreductase n=1 Tax=Saccharothrix yanglingensis TaxID=659496 RepID=UPI0027D339A0|nr:SDR family NAD(P)-dependent oxidoreductase [Saccharothrix yanglingensis]